MKLRYDNGNISIKRCLALIQNEINVVLADDAGDRESPKNLDTSYSENLPSDQINTESIDV